MPSFQAGARESVVIFYGPLYEKLENCHTKSVWFNKIYKCNQDLTDALPP